MIGSFRPLLLSEQIPFAPRIAESGRWTPTRPIRLKSVLFAVFGRMTEERNTTFIQRFIELTKGDLTTQQGM